MNTFRRSWIGRVLSVWIAAALLGCGPASQRRAKVAADEEAAMSVDAEADAAEKPIRPPVPPEKAPDPSPRIVDERSVDKLARPIETWFDQHRGARTYLQLDKPLYRPGETVWFSSVTLDNRSFEGAPNISYMTFQLISPRGSSVMEQNASVRSGRANGDFSLPSDLVGGEYLLRATASDGSMTERPFIVSAYEAPRIKKELEFLRKAYGTGDTVQAAVEIKRPTGEVLAGYPLQAVVQLDGGELERLSLTTDAKGSALVRFVLPSRIENGDGLLTVLVEEGGVTESVSKRIPIVLDKVRLSFYPEGGKLVSGLSSRVYFEAQNTLGKPADIEGRVVDDHGNRVAELRSYHQGMGRFELRPASGRRYSVEITKPAGIKETFDLPLAEAEGCVLRGYDDFDSQLDAIRAAVSCTTSRQVTMTAMLRENLLDYATVAVPRNEAATVYLRATDKKLSRAQGIVRLTVFDADLVPLAERIVYRNRRNNLKVTVTPDKASYTPRDHASLAVKTVDAFGTPVSAELALSVVDDTVVSYADDKTGHLLSRLYLESEIPDKIEEPKVYFDLTEEKSAKGLDMLLGTKGWRTFEWRSVFAPPSHPAAIAYGAPPMLDYAVEEPVPEMAEMVKEERPQKAKRQRGERRGPMPKAAPAPRRAAAKPAAPLKFAEEMDDFAGPPMERAAEVQVEDKMDRILEADPDEALMPAPIVAADEEPAFDGMRDMKEEAVRVFPLPDYSKPYDGPRTDFRDTIFWSPSVTTDEEGKGTVSFYLSDAVTSFRVFAEGVGGGEGGRIEKVFKSNLPFSMNIKVPTEVSSGDRMKLPLTLTNETRKSLMVALTADFGELMKLEGAESREISLAPGERKSLLFDVTVTGVQGESAVSVKASAGGLADSFNRTITVAPKGFPVEQSFSGQVALKAEHTVDLRGAVRGSVMATVKAYPSPTATMIAGMEGMLNEPGGCFEQASSTNYPNVMILDYLERRGEADPALTERSRGLLDSGYRLLTGYESPKQGYEWFGSNPGHEALTAYGLLEFVDMKGVYGTVDQRMIDRTARWLLSRRDGKGGFMRNPQALDSFGAASPAVTDAYIIYSLTEAGYGKGLKAEIARMQKTAAETKDPYLLALATGALLNTPDRSTEAKAAAARLAKMQDKEGAWTGADHSITRSGGENLTIETTALSVLALLKAGGYGKETARAVEWLISHRDGYGNWGATQATVLGIKAFSAYADATRKTDWPGSLTVLVNGKVATQVEYEAGHRGPLSLLLSEKNGLVAGMNTVKILHEGEGELPYSMAVAYRTEIPASSKASPVELNVRAAKKIVPLGESVRVTATVTNRQSNGLPMTLARVGLPGGLTFQTWQLKELRDKQLIDFYETRAREVILYFRDMKPGEKIEVPLDLVAVVPGNYTAPASSAYLYYTDEHKTWADPIVITVEADAAPEG